MEWVRVIEVHADFPLASSPWPRVSHRFNHHFEAPYERSHGSRNPMNFGNLGASFAPLGWCMNFTNVESAKMCS